MQNMRYNGIKKGTKMYKFNQQKYEEEEKKLNKFHAKVFIKLIRNEEEHQSINEIDETKLKYTPNEYTWIEDGGTQLCKELKQSTLSQIKETVDGLEDEGGMRETNNGSHRKYLEDSSIQGDSSFNT